MPATSANTITLILLRLSLIICALFSASFLALTQLHDARLGTMITLGTAAIGLYFLTGTMRALLRELDRTPTAPRPGPSRLSRSH